MLRVAAPADFLHAGEDPTDLYDDSALAVNFSWIAGYRVVYQRLRQNWTAYSPDLDGVISTGATLEEVDRTMREAIPFHLEGMAEDQTARPWLYALRQPSD